MSWNDQVIEEFRSNEGRVGGRFEGGTVLLLHTEGARTGRKRIIPLVTVRDGDRFLVAASKGGADSHPDWYFNVKANPNVTFEVGSATVAGRATIIDSGPERDAVYAKLGAKYPFFPEYEIKTDRTIPVIVLEPTS